jgi:thioredoxin reductase (NADPH)
MLNPEPGGGLEYMSSESCDVVIIGSGPAGMTAALYAARFGLNPVVFGDIPGGSLYMIETIRNFPGFADGVGGTEFGIRLFQHAQVEGARFTMSRIRKLAWAEGLFHATNTEGRTFTAPMAVVATGRTPVSLPVANGHLKGIHVCSLCDGPLYRNKNAVLAVIGSGNAAAQHTMILSGIAEKVYLIYRSPKPLMDAVHGHRLSERKNLEMLDGVEVIGFEGLDMVDSVRVRFQDGRLGEIPVHGVFVSVGWKPDTNFLDFPVVQSPDGYLRTDSRLMTSVPGLFAAGDVRDTDMYQILTACADGARVAEYALEYRRSISLG